MRDQQKKMFPALCVSSKTISSRSRAELSQGSNSKNVVPKSRKRRKELCAFTRYSKCIDPRGVYRPWEIRRPVYRKNTHDKTVTGRQKEQETRPPRVESEVKSPVQLRKTITSAGRGRGGRAGIFRLVLSPWRAYKRRLNISARPLRVDTGTGSTGL